MKSFIGYLIIVLAFAVLLVAYMDSREVNGLEVRPVPARGAIQVEPHYGAQKTAPGMFLQPATYCLQNCNQYDVAQ